jgi:hypothetical protein
MHQAIPKSTAEHEIPDMNSRHETAKQINTRYKTTKEINTKPANAR